MSTLVAPDTTGWTVLTHPGTAAPWTPPMSGPTDYVLLPPANKRVDYQVILQGGRKAYMLGWHTTRADVDGGPNIMVDGGDAPGYVFLHGHLADCSGGKESDFIRTRKSVIHPGSGQPGERGIKMLDCRVMGLRGQTSGATDDFGNPSSATHADIIQLAGGSGDITIENFTGMSRYSAFQLQQEQSETGAYGTISALSRVGSVATLDTSAAHGLVVGDYIQVGDGVQAGGTACSPSTWNGTFQVATRPSTTRITFGLGDATPAAFSNPGVATWKKSLRDYLVGSVSLTNVNFHCDVNGQQFTTLSPGETLNCLRVGGRPDFKGFEDRTPMTDDAWAGSLTLSEVYVNIYNSNLTALLNPGSSASVYSVVRGSLNTGVTPNEWTWPNWPKVTGKIFKGVPAGGDFCPAWRPGLGYPKVAYRRAV